MGLFVRQGAVQEVHTSGRPVIISVGEKRTSGRCSSSSSQLPGGLSDRSGLLRCGNPSAGSGGDFDQTSLCSSVRGSTQGRAGLCQREVNAGLPIHPCHSVDAEISHRSCDSNIPPDVFHDFLRLERLSQQRADQPTAEELRSLRAQCDSSVAETKKVRKPCPFMVFQR